MLTSSLSFAGGFTLPTRISAKALASLVVMTAMLSSTIVFSEPAVVDALLAAVVIVIPVLGIHRFGKIAVVNLMLWLAIVAAGLFATMSSTTFDTGLKHQVVTLFLVVSAFVMAGYVATDPEPALRRLMWCYLVACLFATLAALIGYFRLLPAAYDLFTNYGRARGTFKDPNVYGAVLVPALTFATWQMLRAPQRQALIAAGLAVPLVLGLLLSFSRGAWLSAALSIAILGGVLLVRSRRASDFNRFGIAAALGTVVLIAAVGMALQNESVRGLLEQRASLDQSYDQGPEGRFGGQRKAIALLLDNPLGIGTHTFRDTYHAEEVHNVYLSTFLNAGWLGGLFYILSVVVTIVAGLRVAFSNSPTHGLALVLSASFIATAIEGFVIDTDHWRHFFILMALIWGAADGKAVATAQLAPAAMAPPPAPADQPSPPTEPPRQRAPQRLRALPKRLHPSAPPAQIDAPSDPRARLAALLKRRKSER